MFKDSRTAAVVRRETLDDLRPGDDVEAVGQPEEAHILAGFPGIEDVLRRDVDLADLGRLSRRSLRGRSFARSRGRRRGHGALEQGRQDQKAGKVHAVMIRLSYSSPCEIT